MALISSLKLRNFMKCSPPLLGSSGALLFWGLLGLNLPALAQIQGDNTILRPSSVRTEGSRWIITDGTQQGANLFHSFRQFSVPEDNTASFQGIEPGVRNVFVRVTGAARSNISGAIELRQLNHSISSANLFLLNPNGILFGSKAALNIGGSFIATTADRVNFNDGTQFSATNPQASPLLTISTPVGLQFGHSPGSIINQSIVQNISSLGTPLQDAFTGNALGLRVLPGQTLALVGGSLDLQGGGLVAGSEAHQPGGRIELASVAGDESVSLTAGNGGWNLGFSDVRHFGTVDFTQGAIVNASGSTGGAIVVHGREVQLTQGSQIFSVTQGSGRGEPLIVDASKQLTIAGFQDYNSSLYTYSQGRGRSGDVRISTGQLTLRNGAGIQSITESHGRGGDIRVEASHLITVAGAIADTSNTNFGIISTLETQASKDGRAGDLNLTTDQLIIRNGGEIGSTTSGTGQGGNVLVNASASIHIQGISTLPGLADDARGGNLLTQTSRKADHAGTAGNLTVITDRVQIQGGGQIASSTVGSGDGGTLTIRAREIDLDGVALDENGSPFLSSPRDGRLPYPSGLFAGVSPDASGNGGQLRVETQQLRMSDGAVLQTATYGKGDAGDLIVNAADLIDVSGTSKRELFPTGLVAIAGGIPDTNFRSVPQARGAGGNLRITTGRLIVRDGAVAAVSSLNPNNQGGAGQLQIQAQTVLLDRGQLTSATESVNGGNIILQAQDSITMQHESAISGRAARGGNGGNVVISANAVTAAPGQNNDILANADRGNGGNIFIFTHQPISGLQEGHSKPPNSTNDIDASSQFGQSGTVSLSLPVDTELQPLTLASAEPVQGCQVTGGQAATSFFNTGRGGLPPTPYKPLSSVEILDDVRLPSPDSSSATPQTQSDRPIVEANGWRVEDDGKVVLMTTVPSTQSQGLCHLR